MGRALVVVDIQNDFCEGGSLAVEGGTAVARAVSQHLGDHRHRYDVVIATRDWHIDPGSHFSPTPDFVDTWPPHCVPGTYGAEFSPALDEVVDFLACLDAIVSKGQRSAAYSGFEGTTDDGRTLLDILRTHDVAAIDLVGLATDYCDLATARDALAAGLSVRLITSMCAGVAVESTAAALAEMEAAGVELIDVPVWTDAPEAGGVSQLEQ